MWSWIFPSEQTETDISIWLPTEISRNFCYNGAKTFRSSPCSPSVFSNAVASNCSWSHKQKKHCLHALKCSQRHGWVKVPHWLKNSVYNISIYLFFLDITKDLLWQWLLLLKATIKFQWYTINNRSLCIFLFIIHQIFSLARDWSKRVMWPNTGGYHYYPRL